MGGHKVYHSEVDDGGNQYNWFLKEFKTTTEWPNSIDTTHPTHDRTPKAGWFPYGVPFGADIWKIWGTEGLVKRPAKVSRAQRAEAKLNTYWQAPPDHCQEFYMNFQKCLRDKHQYYNHIFADVPGKGGTKTGDCGIFMAQVNDCWLNEQVVGVALHERVKRIQDHMNIDYLPKGWF
ncbi:unnamed protein product [Oikopleura dioica]|uniref:Uncharacterized protein n=1 Tax=Oikopleura dioica TaxID=34765 RepID=E4XK08_OIKDI|nr:unnamed protein product [Oikopleura dioica]